MTLLPEHVSNHEHECNDVHWPSLIVQEWPEWYNNPLIKRLREPGYSSVCRRRISSVWQGEKDKKGGKRAWSM